MYNNPYEEYIRNSLGYNINPMMNMSMGMNQTGPMMEMYETEGNFVCNQTSVDDMYPEIYKIVYPMICKACMTVNENVTEDLVSRITNEIYMNVEHMEVEENRSSTIEVRPSKSIKNESINKTTSNSIQNASRQETRQRNPLLRDLIRILVLRELIGNPGRPLRPRPPFNPPGRPPFGPGPRPPFGF